MYSAGSHRTLLLWVWSFLRTPVLLMMIGICSATLSYLVNVVVVYDSQARGRYIDSKVVSPESFAWFALWTVVLISLSAVLTYAICPEAVGGGIAEIRAILNGIVKPVLLTKRLIFAKCIGLTLARCSRISIGNEGPFVHISCALADQLMRISGFREIRNHDYTRMDILACACGAGVAATFGTPFGGVLFSIELTTSVYGVKNLPKAFLTAVCAMLVFLYFKANTELISMFNISTQGTDELSTEEVTASDVLLVVCVGVVCGILGVLFVRVLSVLISIRNYLVGSTQGTQFQIAKRRYGVVIAVVVLFLPLMYLEFVLSRAGSGYIEMDTVFKPGSQFQQLPLPHLVAYCVYKFIFTAFSIVLPLPVGLFTPIFLTGGVLGRLLARIVTLCGIHTNLQAWEFAAIGAASLITGASHTISTAVIVYELTGQQSLRLSVTISILAAYFVGTTFATNVYDVFGGESGTPLHYDLPPELFPVPVSMVMASIDSTHVLSLDSTYLDAVELLRRYDREEAQYKTNTATTDISISNNVPDGRLQSRSRSAKPAFVSSQVIPVVKSSKAMIIVGAILRENLKRVLREVHHMSEIAEADPIVLGEDPDDLEATTGQFAETFREQSNSQSDQSTLDTNRPPPLDVSIVSSSSASMSQLNSPIEGTSLPSSESPNRPAYLRGKMSSAGGIYSEVIQYVVSDSDNVATPVASSSSLKGRRRNSWSMMAYAITLDTSPYQIVDTMQLHKVDTIFRLLKLNQAYITRNGKLVGVITRSMIREYVTGFVANRAAAGSPVAQWICRNLGCCTRKTGYQEIPEVN